MKSRVRIIEDMNDAELWEYAGTGGGVNREQLARLAEMIRAERQGTLNWKELTLKRRQAPREKLILRIDAA